MDLPAKNAAADSPKLNTGGVILWDAVDSMELRLQNWLLILICGLPGSAGVGKGITTLDCVDFEQEDGDWGLSHSFRTKSQTVQ